MLPEKLKKVLSYEGVVSITTWTEAGPHVTNTWNSYTETTDDDRILIPAAGMTSTEEDLAVNANLILTAGTREVEGFNGYKGTGFRITGTAAMIEKGDELYDERKISFSPQSVGSKSKRSQAITLKCDKRPFSGRSFLRNNRCLRRLPKTPPVCGAFYLNDDESHLRLTG